MNHGHRRTLKLKYYPLTSGEESRTQQDIKTQIFSADVGRRITRVFGRGRFHGDYTVSLFTALRPRAYVAAGLMHSSGPGDAATSSHIELSGKSMR